MNHDSEVTRVLVPQPDEVVIIERPGDPVEFLEWSYLPLQIRIIHTVTFVGWDW